MSNCENTLKLLLPSSGRNTHYHRYNGGKNARNIAMCNPQPNTTDAVRRPNGDEICISCVQDRVYNLASVNETHLLIFKELGLRNVLIET